MLSEVELITIGFMGIHTHDALGNRIHADIRLPRSAVLFLASYIHRLPSFRIRHFYMIDFTYMDRLRGNRYRIGTLFRGQDLQHRAGIIASPLVERHRTAHWRTAFRRIGTGPRVARYRRMRCLLFHFLVPLAWQDMITQSLDFALPRRRFSSGPSGGASLACAR